MGYHCQSRRGAPAAGGSSLTDEEPSGVAYAFAVYAPTHPIRTQYYTVLLTIDYACTILLHVRRQTPPLPPNRDPPHPPSTNPFRIRTSTKPNMPLCNPNRINAIFQNSTTLHQTRSRNPRIYNTYKHCSV